VPAVTFWMQWCGRIGRGQNSGLGIRRTQLGKI
jgi:hypothetical protein